MKKIGILIFFLQSLAAFSQFSDDFSDGLFMSGQGVTRNVEWTGDVGDFIVNASRQLQLYAEGNQSPSQLKTSSSALANTSWEFYVKMDFALTSSNYAKIYLASDEAELAGELNGYFIRVGYTDKNICLIASQKGKNNQTLIAGAKQRLNSTTSNAVKIKATLDVDGHFELYSQLESESDFTLEGSATLSNLPSTQWFGIVCFYSSTRSKLFYFDDFDVKVLDNNVEPGIPYDLPEEGDIVFSEIMANPASGNPEYVELYNTRDKPFQLKDCVFLYGENPYSLPDRIIAPHSYFVLSKTAGVDWFETDIEAYGVTSFPTLANTGKLLAFENSRGGLVSWFEYSDAMYGDNTKKAGGWALECIDLSNRSNTAKNWSASTDAAGGTPGRTNSIAANNPDATPPVILSYSQADNHTVNVVFSKPMNRQKLSDANAYQISETAYQIADLQTSYPKGNELSIQLNNFPPQGNFIEIELQNMEDLSGNALAGDKALIIGEAFEADPNDIIINELLFNPPGGGNEYVEIYNRSGKLIDLRSISITSRKPSDGSLNKLYPLTELPLFLHPEEYLVITKNWELVGEFFNCRPESFYVELPVMPSIANASGCVVIVNNHNNAILDEFAYNENMHSKEISNKKGVSLERVAFEKASSEATNWLSASAQSGYGTPGYENSQHQAGTGLPERENKLNVYVEYPFSGADEYRIKYQLDKAGYKCKIEVYDSSGRIIDRLLNNELSGIQGEISWNGKAKSKRSLTAGVYILYMELYDSIGNIQKIKLPVVVK
jgi:hypothetical protein